MEYSGKVAIVAYLLSCCYIAFVLGFALTVIVISLKGRKKVEYPKHQNISGYGTYA